MAIVKATLNKGMLGYKAGATIITNSVESIVGLIYDKDDLHIGHFINTALNHKVEENDFSNIEEITLPEKTYYNIFSWTAHKFLQLPVESFNELLTK